MIKIGVVVVAAVLVLAGLSFATVEVPSVNEVEGAVAFTHPTLTTTAKSSFSVGTISVGLDGTLKYLEVAFATPIQKYEAPAPRRISWLESLLPTGTISSGSSEPMPISQIPQPSCGTSATYRHSNETKVYTIVVTLDVRSAAGEVSTWSSDPQDIEVSVEKVVVMCLVKVESTSYWAKADAVLQWAPGAYYFTDGFGVYTFDVRALWVVGEQRTTVGTQVVSVDLTPSSF